MPEENYPQWIPIKERKPEKNGPYLIFWETADPKVPAIFMGYWHSEDNGQWGLIPPVLSPFVSHWMPLPPPPPKVKKVRKPKNK